MRSGARANELYTIKNTHGVSVSVFYCELMCNKEDAAFDGFVAVAVNRNCPVFSVFHGIADKSFIDGVKFRFCSASGAGDSAFSRFSVDGERDGSSVAIRMLQARVLFDHDGHVRLFLEKFRKP